jgi:hypothetical protein
VEVVLARRDSEAEVDPFAVAGEGMSGDPAGTDGLPATLAAINAKLEMYSAEHDWDDTGSLGDFRCALLAGPSCGCCALTRASSHWPLLCLFLSEMFEIS